MKRDITEKLVRRGEEERAFDREFWRHRSAQEKFDAAWQMVVDYYLLRGKDADELRLQRTVEKLKRRER